MKVYIGAPIDAAAQNPAQVFTELTQAVLSVVPGAICYNPYTAWCNAQHSNPETFEYLWAVNDYALMAADLAVFGWTGSPTVGVPIEIYRRHRQELPFAVIHLAPRPQASLYLQHLCGAKLFHTTEQFSSWLEGYKNAEKLLSTHHTGWSAQGSELRQAIHQPLGGEKS